MAAAAEPTGSDPRWPAERAWEWRRRVGWLVGCNYAPATAVNQLEMWGADTFDPRRIDLELGWAADLGFNSMRVFLHDLLWTHDRDGFLDRMSRYLDISAKHGIGALFVFFDSCWYPFPYWGKQREPEPGVHNSFWLQSPGVPVLRDPAKFDRLEDYVVGVVRRFADDQRVHGWDAWNEPDNSNERSYGPRDFRSVDEKGEAVAPLLAKTFAWIRSAAPAQPATSAPWTNHLRPEDEMNALQRTQLEQSDVISFHQYSSPEITRKTIDRFIAYGRPALCTEYMARPAKSTFQDVLPLFRQHEVGAYNWGFVAGRTQTNYPWETWAAPDVDNKLEWLHEVLHTDGTPYRQEEVDAIRRVTGRTAR